MNKFNKASPSTVVRVAVVALAAGSMLSGCGDSKPVGTVGYVKGFAGLVAADEPRAALAARDVLSAGGTAADAATTLYFSLAVTLPSTASLGGGGSCVAYDTNRKVAEVVDFRAPAASPGTGPAVAVPVNPRGFYLLQARYGKLRWESLLAEPERMAREGVAVTRAFANDLAVAAPRLAQDAEARRLFFRPDGRVLGEGDRMHNLDLAAVLAGLRRAPGDFYSGLAARNLVAAAAGIGAGLTLDDLNAARPWAGSGTSLPIGDDVAMLPATGASTVTHATSMLRHGITERLHLVSAATGSPAPDQGYVPGTGFVVLDSYGSAVACAVSANGLFGTGRVLPGTGIVLAAPPAAGMPPALPALVYNNNSAEVHFAGTAAGGADPAAALATAMVAAGDQGKGAGEAIAAAAAGLPEPARSRLEVLACASGSPNTSRCTVATDPRGFGYAVAVGKD